HTGLDRPLPVQYVTYLGNLLHGDMGTSRLTGRPVREDLGEYAPAPIEVALAAIVLAPVVGVALGTVAATPPARWPDPHIRAPSSSSRSSPGRASASTRTGAPRASTCRRSWA